MHFGQISKKFRVYFIDINFLRNQTKKFTVEPKSYTEILLYFFPIFHCLLHCQKKKYGN